MRARIALYEIILNYIISYVINFMVLRYHGYNFFILIGDAGAFGWSLGRGH